MKYIVWLSMGLYASVAFSQEKATFSFTNTAISKVLFSLEKTYNVRFSYSDEIIKDTKISLLKKERLLTETLSEITQKSNLIFDKIDERYIIIRLKKTNLNKMQFLSEVIVSDYLTKGITKNKKGFYKINTTKLGILPGLTESDILESIQQLPGVVSPNETTTGLVVRGGTPDQNSVIWDAINIYHSGHLFGMVSAFNPAIAQHINFHNKGTNPRFGEGISSVIDIQSNTTIPKKATTKISINGISASAFIEVPLLKNKLSAQASFRRSYTDLYQSTTFNRMAEKVFQSTKINNDLTTTNFYFVDYNAKINYQVHKQHLFSLSSISINNSLEYSDFNKDTNNTSNDILKIKNEGVSLKWQANWLSNISQKTSLSFSEYHFNYNTILKTKNNSITELISNFDKRNVIYDTNFNTEVRIKLNPKTNLDVGYQYSFKDVSYAFLNTTNVVLLLDASKNRISTHSFYSNYNFTKNEFIHLNAGFRLNYYKELDKLKLEPRVVIYKNLYKGLKLQITGEIKNQILSQIDETVLSDLSLENKLWRLSNGNTSPIINSNQISAGLLYQKNGWSFDIDNYYKNTTGITALSLGFLNPDGKTFRIGKQKIKGVDMYVKRNFKNFNTWLSYSYTDVKSKFNDLNNEAYFIANTNITHSVSTSITYRLKQFQMALGWKWRTGKPYTKSNVENNEIIFDGINTERLPNYHRLDLSSTYGFHFSKKQKIKGKIGLSIRNVYNQKNLLSREYTGFNTLDDPIEVRDLYSLRFMPNLFFGVYW